MSEELPEHRVPVTVFVTVRAVDYCDARSVAEMAIRQAFAGQQRTRFPMEIRFQSVRHDVPVQVHQVMETGVAARNGLLWVEATSQAYPREDQ